VLPLGCRPERVGPVDACLVLLGEVRFVDEPQRLVEMSFDLANDRRPVVVLSVEIRVGIQGGDDEVLLVLDRFDSLTLTERFVDPIESMYAPVCNFIKDTPVALG
jgi:hypothetical protein